MFFFEAKCKQSVKTRRKSPFNWFQIYDCTNFFCVRRSSARFSLCRWRRCLLVWWCYKSMDILFLNSHFCCECLDKDYLRWHVTDVPHVCFSVSWLAEKLTFLKNRYHTLWIKWRLKKFRWFNGRPNGSSHKKIVIFGKTTFWNGCFKSLFDQDARDISDEVHFFTRPQVIPAFCSFIFKRITCFVYQVLSWYGVWCRALNNSQLAILPPGFFLMEENAGHFAYSHLHKNK